MDRVEKTVFLSYRRDNASWALAISRDLIHHGYDVFMDYTSISTGSFEAVILDNIRWRAHFIVLLTPSALERCSDPSDWLRLEIEEALHRKRNVVPLFLESFRFGTPEIDEALTGGLSNLKKYNGITVPVEYFDAAMGRLRERLNTPLSAVPHPTTELSVEARTAAHAFRRAVQEAPVVTERELNARWWFEQALSAKSPAERIRLYTEAISLDPTIPSAFNNRGISRRVLGDLSGAMQDLNEAIRLDPHYAAAYNNRGMVRQDLQEMDEALEDFNRAVELDPNDFRAYGNRSLLYESLNKINLAVKDVNKAVQLNPSSVESLCNRGSLRLRMKNIDGAMSDFEDVLARDPQSVPALMGRGQILATREQLQDALRDYDEAIRHAPNYAPAYSDRSLVYFKMGEVSAAISDATTAIRLAPQLMPTYLNRGKFHSSLNEHTAALADFEAVVRLDPRFFDGQFARAETLAKLGRTSEAADRLKTILRTRIASQEDQVQKVSALLSELSHK